MSKQPEPAKKIVEVALAAAVPLDPSKKYLIVCDTAAISTREIHSMADAIRAMGIDATVAGTDGDPWTSVQVIEVGH